MQTEKRSAAGPDGDVIERMRAALRAAAADGPRSDAPPSTKDIVKRLRPEITALLLLGRSWSDVREVLGVDVKASTLQAAYRRPRRRGKPSTNGTDA